MNLKETLLTLRDFSPEGESLFSTILLKSGQVAGIVAKLSLQSQPLLTVLHSTEAQELQAATTAAAKLVPLLNNTKIISLALDVSELSFEK